MLLVRVSRDQRRREIFAPMHWTDRFVSAGPIDRIVGAARDAISGQPGLKATAVMISRVPVLWWGLLLRRSELAVTSGIHWSRVPVQSGHAFRLAGLQRLPDEAGRDYWARTLLTPPATAELITYSDAVRGVFRYASILNERLDACLFVAARRTSLPQREGLAALLGSEIRAAERIGCLAGRAAEAGLTPDAGRIICACFAVGLKVLQHAVNDQRLSSIAEIGAALRAGTNCGSCIPELNEILYEATS